MIGAVTGRSSAEIFISYAWEDRDHAGWVEALAIRLRTQDGVDVKLDRWEAQPGDQLTRFMEAGVRDSRFVILVCTPAYKAKFDARLGGVGYEATAIAGEIHTGLAKRKVIPVHRRGSWTEAAPSIVLGDYYVDLTGSPYRDAEYRKLVDMLHGRREPPPPLGHADVAFEGPGAAPAKPVQDFSGRDIELGELVAHLRAPDEKAVCVVASGIGGVGKTALARQLVATLAPRLFPEGSAWLEGKSLTSELARVARRFGWGELADPTPLQATAFLAKQLNGRAVLLVIDDLPAEADSAHVPIPGGKCRTLITSRAVNKAQDLGVPAETIRLEHWDAPACRAYLRKVVPRLLHEPDGDLDALSVFVGGLPLAIRLVARALVDDRERSARVHLDRLKGEPLGALDGFAGGPDRGVAATFLDAYHALSDDARRTLHTLAVCAQGTRREIVAAVAGLDSSVTGTALNALADVSLAEFRDYAAAPWSLHDVVRMFVCAQPGGAEAEAAHLAWVKDHINRYPEPTDHEGLEAGVAEVLAAFDRLLGRGAGDQADDLLDSAWHHLFRRGRYGLLIDLIERLLVRLPVGGVAASYWIATLGLCCRRMGDIPKAIELHQRALAIYEKTGDLVGQAVNLGNIGICYRQLRDIFKAIDFFQRSLAIDEKIGRLEGQATQVGNLGVCYNDLGDLTKAMDYYQRALAIDEQLGRLEGQALQLRNLGSCYALLDDMKGLDFLERALAIEQKLGRLEGQARAILALSSFHGALGDLPKAIELLQRSLALFREMGLPEDHSDISSVMQLLATARASLGESEDDPPGP